MGGGGSKASGGGSKGSGEGSHGVSVVGNLRSHDSRFSCPSGGESRYSNHDICLKGRVYSDKGRAEGCYDRTDKFCSTDISYSTKTVKGHSSSGSYPSGHSGGRGGKGREGGSDSSSTHQESRGSRYTGQDLSIRDHFSCLQSKVAIFDVGYGQIH
jgi:hypothetical protein